MFVARSPYINRCLLNLLLVEKTSPSNSAASYIVNHYTYCTPFKLSVFNHT